MLDDLFESKTDLGGIWIPEYDGESLFPVGERSYLHQQQTFEALRSQDCEAVLNTNPTGAGKTLSWVAPTIRSGEWGRGWIVLATYPTKALVEDQHSAIRELFERYYTSDEYESEREFQLKKDEGVLTDGDEEYTLSERVVQATSDSVDSTTTEIKKAYRRAIDPADAGVPTIVLTTPDTLTLIAAGLPFDSDETSVLINFDKIVVDEFHLANPRGKRLLPFHLDVTMSMPSYAELENLVFLSATPLPDYVRRVDDAFHTRHITNETYDAQNTRTRQILPEANLFVASREMFTNGEWLADNVYVVADFYSSSGQMLIVLDSVREVDDVYNALEEETELTPGRIYGWKKKGRAETIEEADVVVGNTAVEVGIDFKDLNRVISTAYDPTSTIQRIGRMRYREGIEDYKIALITTPNVQSEIAKQGQGNRLEREEFEKILIEGLGESADIPYYELLCAAYSHYLWYDSKEYEGDSPLRGKYGPHDGKAAEERFSEIVHRHFGDGASEVLGENLNVDELWESADEIRQRFYKDGYGKYPLFKEMHAFRPSSLSCLILDVKDRDEPVKTYQLHHVLKYCDGYLVEGKEKFKEECEERLNLNNSIRDVIEDNSDYVCAYFVATGKRYDAPRYYKITDYAWSDTMKNRWKEPGKISEIWNPSIETNPAIKGTEHVQFDDDGNNQEILARYVGYSRDDAINEYRLGPYANATQIGEDSTILFWQDGILAEAQIAYEYFRRMHESE